VEDSHSRGQPLEARNLASSHDEYLYEAQDESSHHSSSDLANTSHHSANEGLPADEDPHVKANHLIGSAIHDPGQRGQ